MMELLLANGANVNALWNGNYPIVCTPCECLSPKSLKWLLDHGADPRVDATKYGSPLSMLVGTYSRDPEGKHACLEVLAQAGLTMLDTPCMAFHRGRVDLLEAQLKRDPGMLSRHFSDAEIFPRELGLKANEGMHFTPIIGATLLHLAIEYDDLETARWLLDHGADVNATSAIDADGFGGHTPLFHCGIATQRRDDIFARLLLDRGANPNARATIRKQLRDMGDPEKEKMFEFHNVTPIGYARRYQEPRWVNEAALKAIAERGGVE
jgi:ankyrin repeat protein